MIMTRLRKLELVTGLATALLAVCVSFLMLEIDRDVAKQLERDFAAKNTTCLAPDERNTRILAWTRWNRQKHLARGCNVLGWAFGLALTSYIFSPGIARFIFA